MISPFPDCELRTVADLACKLAVAALVREVVVAHVSLGGSPERLAAETSQQGDRGTV